MRLTTKWQGNVEGGGGGDGNVPYPGGNDLYLGGYVILCCVLC